MSICEVKSFYKCRIPRPTRPCGNPVKVKSVVRPQKKCGIPRPIRPWGRPVSVGRKVKEAPKVSVRQKDPKWVTEGTANVKYDVWWFLAAAMRILNPINFFSSMYEDVVVEIVN